MSLPLADAIELNEEAEGHLDAIGGATARRLAGWLAGLPALPASACPVLTWWPTEPRPRHARFGAHVALIRVKEREGRVIAVVFGVLHERDLVAIREESFAETKQEEGE